MNNVFLVLIFCSLVLINNKLNKLIKNDDNTENKVKDKKSFKDLLPLFKGKYCEISLSEFLSSLDHLYNGMMNIKAFIIDYDDEWVILETCKKDKKYKHIIKISLIKDIIEINE